MILNEFFNLPQVFEKDMTEDQSQYTDMTVAQQVFKDNPNIDHEDDILNAAFPYVVELVGSRKRANYMFNYDEDFPSDLISAYRYLQRDQHDVGLEEGTGQDSKSWMASIRQQHPDVKFIQAKMPGAPIIALVNGKPVAQFDTKKGVAEGTKETPFGSVSHDDTPVKPQQYHYGTEPSDKEIRKQRLQNVRQRKQDLLKDYAQMGALRVELIHGINNDVFLNKDQLLDYFDHLVDDPELTPLEYAHENGIPTDGLLKGMLRRAAQLGVSALDVRKLFASAKAKQGVAEGSLEEDEYDKMLRDLLKARPDLTKKYAKDVQKSKDIESGKELNKLVKKNPGVLKTYSDAVKRDKKLGVAEGHADQQRKIFKKNGHPVGEVGIDRESSPGNGQWYMKYYATGDDFSGYDSMEEAVADLKHLVNQFKAEGVAEAAPSTELQDKMRQVRPKGKGITRTELQNAMRRKGKKQWHCPECATYDDNVHGKFCSKYKPKEQGVAEGLPQTLRKVVPGYAKREIDQKMDAEKFGRTDVDRDANFHRYKKIQDKIKNKGVAEGFFGSRPNPVLPIVDKIAKVAGGLTPQNVEVGKQIIQANARDITRMLSPQDKAGIDVIEGTRERLSNLHDKIRKEKDLPDPKEYLKIAQQKKKEIADLKAQDKKEVGEGKGDYVPPKEANYDEKYQAMVKRVGEKAKQQEKSKQQPKQPVRESRRALLKQIIQS